MFLNFNKKSELKNNSVNFSTCFNGANGESNVNIENVDLVTRFCLPVCSREVKVREAALLEIERSVECWLDGYSSPTLYDGPSSLCLPPNNISTEGVTNGTQDNLALIALHVPTLLRLSASCPFPDVRIKCGQILQVICERGVSVPFYKISQGPSSFIPLEELPSWEILDEQTHVLLIDAFLQNNRLDHVTQVMSYHPKYLDVFMRTQNFILRGDGPLPYDYRHYIAIMAAGRHQCSYLIQLQKQEFLMQGGDKAWLKGLGHIPQKLRNLYEINKILAHRPWLLNKFHIQKLTKGTDNWSLSEVVHAIVLLVHFHCLCSFVFGCGVSEEADTSDARDGTSMTESSRTTSELSDIDTGVGVDTLMQRMKTLSEQQEEFSAEERAKRFERVELQSVELGTSSGLKVKPSIGHFVEDPDFIYEDFARRGEVSSIPTFRVQDYSWDDQGYSLVNRLYNDVGNLLDDKFKTAYNLTYYTMGGRRDVDTSRFRRAIWNYIQCMFGIRHDDYDYGEVNQLLERSLKSFIKSTCCFPERTTKADYDRVLREFKHSEKVHVNIMVLEARMQAELLYALRAIMRYMT